MSIGHGHPMTKRERDEWAADERMAEHMAEFDRLHPETRRMGYLERAPLFYAWLTKEAK